MTNHNNITRAIMASPSFLCETAGGTLLSVKVQPRASKNEIGAPLGDELKIKVTAPPVDAAANGALVKLLAGQLDCARGRVELIRGHKIAAQGCETSRLRAGRSAQKTFSGHSFVNFMKLN